MCFPLVYMSVYKHWFWLWLYMFASYLIYICMVRAKFRKHFPEVYYFSFPKLRCQSLTKPFAISFTIRASRKQLYKSSEKYNRLNMCIFFLNMRILFLYSKYAYTLDILFLCSPQVTWFRILSFCFKCIYFFISLMCSVVHCSCLLQQTLRNFFMFLNLFQLVSIFVHFHRRYLKTFVIVF